MSRADHLRKINHDRLEVTVLDHDVEFVEIAVDQAGVGEADDEFHQLAVEVGRADGVLGDLAAATHQADAAVIPSVFAPYESQVGPGRLTEEIRRRAT